jgi:hypothetical protein
VLYNKSHQVVTAASHEKDEDHREEDAFVIQTRCQKNLEKKKK